MSRLGSMLETHPRASSIDVDTLNRCIEACFECVEVCSSCADACLGEPMVHELIGCARVNLDCADVCSTTGRLVTRRTEPKTELIRQQLGACVIACQLCAEACERHAGMHEHCRVCAETCRRCEAACHAVLRAM
jgi:hypothetical protein